MNQPKHSARILRLLIWYGSCHQHSLKTPMWELTWISGPRGMANFWVRLAQENELEGQVDPELDQWD